MIEPINISPLETTASFRYKCDSCGKAGTDSFTNRVINVDNGHDLEELSQEPCPNCQFPLGTGRGKKFQIKLKTGEVINKKAKNKEELMHKLSKWLATGASGVVGMKRGTEKRVTHDSIEEITEVSD